MLRREFLTKGLVTGAAIFGAPFINRGRFRLFAGTGAEYSARTIDLVRRSVVIDMLGLLTLDWRKMLRWEKVPGSFTSGDADFLRSSGITVFHPAVELPASDSFEATRQWFCGINKFLANYPQYFLRINCPDDIQNAKSQGKIGILVGMQNGCHFRSVSDVKLFHQMGQRLSQLTYNTRNTLGCGCTVQKDTGLTAFGAAIIEEMNRVRMAVDVSHAGERTAQDAFEASKQPVLITHSNCRALVPNQPRCVTDATIRKMAACGGVMGITGVRTFVSNGEPTTIEDVLDHFDHVVRLAGIEHVGVGSDNDLAGRDRSKRQRKFDIEGLDHPQRIFDLTEGLIRRGYSDSAIALILGGNFRRVLAQIWA